MKGCMGYLSLVNILRGVDDRQLSPCGESLALTLDTLKKAHHKICIHPYKFTLYFKHFWCFTLPSDKLFLCHYNPSTVKHLYSYMQVQL